MSPSPLVSFRWHSTSLPQSSQNGDFPSCTGHVHQGMLHASCRLVGMLALPSTCTNSLFLVVVKPSWLLVLMTWGNQQEGVQL